MRASERVTAGGTGWSRAVAVLGVTRGLSTGHPLLLRTAWALVALLALGLPSRADAQSAETPNFTIEYHHADLSGNIRLTTDEYGAVVREAIHLPFGERDTGECGTLEDGARPLGYQGKPRDPKTCLDDFGARDYRAAIGRFQTVDPVLPADRALRDPQQWNRYAYARNNPLIYSDPDGRILAPILIGAVTGAAFDAGMHALSNVRNGRAWHEGTGEAALRGAAMGAVTGVAGQLILGARAAPIVTKIVSSRSVVASAKELNKIAHIFPTAQKNLQALVNATGSELKALRAVQAAADEALAQGRLLAAPDGTLPGKGLGAVLDVSGVKVQLIGGKVMNGIVEIGSFVGL